MLAWLGRLARGLIAPVILFGASGFFVWHAQQGEQRRDERTQDVALARITLGAAEAERKAMERCEQMKEKRNIKGPCKVIKE
jgi:hypothetical protein